MQIGSRRARLRSILPATCGISALLVASALVGPGAAAGSASPAGAGYQPSSIITVTTAKVGAPGNPSVGVVPFTDAVYRSCA